MPTLCSGVLVVGGGIAGGADPKPPQARPTCGGGRALREVASGGHPELGVRAANGFDDRPQSAKISSACRAAPDHATSQQVLKRPVSIHDAARALVYIRVDVASVYDEGERQWRKLEDQVEQLINQTRTSPGVPKEQKELWDFSRFLTFRFFSYLKFFDPC
jgi:hypothetical protein